ncbi:RNA 2',3'-cyclic phosphodiesterase [Profundibacter sp.]
MRIFIALDLPDPLLDQLTALQAGLPAGASSKRETLHLTLAFAGDHPQERVEALHDELSLINAPAFDVQLSGLGTFGKSSPTLLYAGVEDNPALEGLQRKVVSAIRRTGLPAPKDRFHPHVTLARFHRAVDARELAHLGEYLVMHEGFRPPAFAVTSFVLFQSTLHPQGARHDELARYALEWS